MRCFEIAVAQNLAKTNKPPLGVFKGDRVCTHVLETLALVVLQQAVPAAEVAIAEATVTHDPLCRLLAVGGGTSELLGSHVDVWGCRPTDLVQVVVVVVVR